MREAGLWNSRGLLRSFLRGWGASSQCWLWFPLVLCCLLSMFLLLGNASLAQIGTSVVGCFACFCCCCRRQFLFFVLRKASSFCRENEIFQKKQKKNKTKFYHFLSQKSVQVCCATYLDRFLTQPWPDFWLNLFSHCWPFFPVRICWNPIL